MRTLVVSDLHLGSGRGSDLLRRPELRAPLLEALDGVDRLVILGDGLELRENAQRDAAALAGPVFADLGAALGPDGELVLVGGNHDHGLVAGWIDGPPADRAARLPRARAADGARTTPGRSRSASPSGRAGARARRLPRASGCATTSTRSTATTPTSTRRCRRSSGSPPARWRAGSCTCPSDDATADAYEAVLAPIYAWMHTLVQRSENGALTGGAGASARAWVALAGEGRRAHPVRAAALGAGYAAAVAAINAIGLGPIDRDLSGQALRRGGLGGMREVLRRLGVEAPWVLWGHSHRSGPWPRDDLAEWTAARRHAAGQHRQLVLPAALPQRRAEPVALLARHRDPASRTAARRS